MRYELWACRKDNKSDELLAKTWSRTEVFSLLADKRLHLSYGSIYKYFYVAEPFWSRIFYRN